MINIYWLSIVVFCVLLKNRLVFLPSMKVHISISSSFNKTINQIILACLLKPILLLLLIDPIDEILYFAYTDMMGLNQKLGHTTLLEELVFWTVKFEFPQKIVTLLLSLLPDLRYKVSTQIISMIKSSLYVPGAHFLVIFLLR